MLTVKNYLELLMVTLKFIKICLIACNPFKPDLELTWREALKKAKKSKNEIT